MDYTKLDLTELADPDILSLSLDDIIFLTGKDLGREYWLPILQAEFKVFIENTNKSAINPDNLRDWADYFLGYYGQKIRIDRKSL